MPDHERMVSNFGLHASPPRKNSAKGEVGEPEWTAQSLSALMAQAMVDELLVNVSDLMDVKEALDDAPKHAMKHDLYGGIAHTCEFSQVHSDKRADDAYEELKTPRGAMIGRTRRPYKDIVAEY